MMVSKTGIGSLDAYLSISGLPAGAAAAFSPEKVSFTDYSRPSLPATLTISTEPSAQPGAYPFVVTARHGSSKKFEIANGTLVIGNSPRFPNQPLLLIEPLPEHSVRLISVATPGQVYHIEATTNLASPQWTTISTQSADAVGFFAFIDLDVTNYPSRFYRTSRSY